MQVTTLAVGQMSSNCYLLQDNSNNCVIVDPGDDGEFIIQKILDMDLKPQAILATHGHFDHILAALELKLAFGIPFYMNKKDEFLLSRMRASTKHFAGFDPGPPPKIDFDLRPDSELKIPACAGRENCKLKIISTPGHTPGSVSVLANDKLFVGDVIFADGSTGRTSHVYSSVKDLGKSIQKILKLPSDTIVYPGHGESFLLKDIT